MVWFFNRNKKVEKRRVDAAVVVEIKDVEAKSNTSIKTADETLNHLNDKLIANGITIQIQAALGGSHGH